MKDSMVWDYTQLASSYHKRPNYPQAIIDKIIDFTGLQSNDRVCDMGAGTANLTILLARRHLRVQALEPNLAMHQLGLQRTLNNQNITWVNTTAENSLLPGNTFDMVSFGSSFNVVDRTTALIESLRICKPNGWFMAIWNHRDLDNPLQQSIEACIKENLPSYDYGLRRQDQRAFIEQSGLFSQIEYFESSMLVTQAIDDVLGAWYSHATLQRQAGGKLADITQNIAKILHGQPTKTIETPYTSRAWVARFRS